MKNTKEERNLSNFSSEKTNSSSFNDESEKSPKFKQRFKPSMNNNPKGRKTVAVPLYAFNGINHDASFKSKLQFFNSKANQKSQHSSLPFRNSTIEEIEIEKNDNKYKKKTKNENDDIDSNININKILDSKNNNNNTNNTKENNAMRFKTFHKKNSVSYSTNQYYTLQSEERLYFSNNPSAQSSISDKKPKEPKRIEKKPDKSKTLSDTEKTNEKCTIQLKSLKDQWYYQKILLDYNILDFTSKFLFL